MRIFVRKLRYFVMAVNFYLEKRADKKGDNPIRVSIAIQGQRLVTSTGYSISPNKWDNIKQEVKRGCSNGKGITYTVINTHLRRIDSFFTEYESKALLNNESEDIRTVYARNFGKDARIGNIAEKTLEKTLFDYLDEFTAEMGTSNDWTKATFEKFAAVKSHLKNFNPNVSFADLTNEGLTDYVNYLRTVQVAGKKYEDKDTRVFGMRNSTIGKQVGFLKWFLRWATHKGYNTEKAFETFSPKLKNAEKKVVFLDWDELMTVYNFPIPEKKKYLDLVRDVFFFCCFTSLRYSDAANLKRSDVFSGYLSITTIKTADSLKIELNDYSKAILKKYEDEALPFGAALPVISNQRMNEYLKELGELCGIDKPVTITYYKGNQRVDDILPKYALLGTHTGRRTFICNALMMGIPPQVVMKWTGHSDYKAMKPYIDVADAAKADAMKLFNKK